MPRWSVVLVAALVAAVPAGAVQAQAEPTDDTTDGPGAPAPTTTVASEEARLVPIPRGCDAPPLPDIVFVGTVVDRDFRDARFAIESVRAGEADTVGGGRIDIRYGSDVEYLEVGEQYLVSARRDPDLGVLASQIREPTPAFGGDDVVGVAEADVDCPLFEDPVRTLWPDGSAIESGVFAPMLDERGRLLGAVVVPLGVAMAVIFVLALVVGSFRGVTRSVLTGGRRR
ncbi:MAG: hypothetical protein MUE78_06055 [Ilumatobacteraceae bacterium]|nr:hypothetical protein [Ilumatobacteraceae bacterium]